MSSSFSTGKVGAWDNSTTSAANNLGCGGCIRPSSTYGGRYYSRRSASRTSDATRCCSRTACLALMVLLLLGDNTSAKSSPRSTSRAEITYSDRAPWKGCHSGQRERQWRSKHQAAWQFFSPSSKAGKATPSFPALRADASFAPLAYATGMVSKGRSKRCRSEVVASAVSSGSDGSNFNPVVATPAQLYSIRRPRDQRGGQGLSLEAEAMARDTLRSPRSAIGDDGREYPESLTAYSGFDSAASNSSPVKAEGLGVAVAARAAQVDRPMLPELTEEDLMQLRAGQRVQKQTRDGGSGSGSVVVDVRADPDVVLDLLTRYEDYAEMIDTVRQCEVFPQERPDQRKVEVTVSRFRLHIRVLMSFLRERNMIQFELDPDCTKAGRAVLREATGFFYVESPPDRPGYSRVWLYAVVDVNRFVPGVIVDYAAGRALPRASTWIKPTCEAAQRKKLRELASLKRSSTA